MPMSARTGNVWRRGRGSRRRSPRRPLNTGATFKGKSDIQRANCLPPRPALCPARLPARHPPERADHVCLQVLTADPAPPPAAGGGAARDGAALNGPPTGILDQLQRSCRSACRARRVDMRLCTPVRGALRDQSIEVRAASHDQSTCARRVVAGRRPWPGYRSPVGYVKPPLKRIRTPPESPPPQPPV